MGVIKIDIRDERLDGGRLTVSSRTSKAATARRRESAIRALLDQGELGIIRRLRDREVRIEELQAAVEKGDLDPLRPQVGESITLGAALDRTLERVRATREPGTILAYITLDTFLREWLGADFDMSQLTSDDAERWLHAPKATMKGGGPWSASRQITMRTLAARVWGEAIDRERELAERHQVKPRLTFNPCGRAHERNILTPTMAVRRLTPRECERLQGFPDDYTLIPTPKQRKLEADYLRYLRASYPTMPESEMCQLAADGPRYKALGNSMAIPPMRWIGMRIAMVDALESADELAKAVA